MKEDANAQETQDEQPQSEGDQAQKQGAKAEIADVTSGQDQCVQAIADRDERINELERQISKAAANKKAAEDLTAKIEQLKARAEEDRIEYALKLAGVRNVKAGKAVLSDHGGDVDALKTI